LAKNVKIAELMEHSGVTFGTSGARGLASAITPEVTWCYTTAFLQHLKKQNRLQSGSLVGIGGDLRPSTPGIMDAAAKAVIDFGLIPAHCGFLPSPALAWFGLEKNIPTIMITGSHIPDDRNGIKYNTELGEITKEDEEGIRAQSVLLPDLNNGKVPVEDSSAEAQTLWRERFRNFFGPQALQGLNLGFYQHSTVGRDSYPQILEDLGATVKRLGYSSTFIPVDTEAIRPEDETKALKWCLTGEFDAIISADGDCDRPLLSDENGYWLRGDVLGILAAKALNATAVATPVSCNSALELSDSFAKIKRTRIGSPFVIAGMEELERELNTTNSVTNTNENSGQKPPVIVGYEANGGFLLQTPWLRENSEGEQKVLAALPTRDAILPVVAVLEHLAKLRKKGLSSTVSSMADQLPPRYTASNRLKDFPTASTMEKLQPLLDENTRAETAEAWFGDFCGKLSRSDLTDGIRLTFDSGKIVHLRPSGNAPELRCYNEASTSKQVLELNDCCMKVLNSWKD